jgi:hypothetical protein
MLEARDSPDMTMALECPYGRGRLDHAACCFLPTSHRRLGDPRGAEQDPRTTRRAGPHRQRSTGHPTGNSAPSFPG